MNVLHGAGWVYDVVDDWTTHPSYQRLRRTLENAYQTIDARADVIFTVSEQLRKRFPRHRRVVWIPNAVDQEHFRITGSEPDDLKGIARPFAMYAGVIEDRIDMPTIEHLVVHMPELPIVFVGPVWPLRFRWLRARAPIRRLASQYRSIVLLGQKSYNDLPRYLSRAAVGLIPHRVNAFTRTMDPLKLYEYLASGIPVVATDVPGPERFPIGVDVAQTLESFTDAVRKRLHRAIDAATLREQVRRETWSARVEQMLSALA
ncbi:MAG: glycosyltransferase [Candidatus Kerfeldbacteria bacterium]|nr:glycosyltransferase [Candidatus Kerfeldbacteria bacterium]